MSATSSYSPPTEDRGSSRVQTGRVVRRVRCRMPLSPASRAPDSTSKSNVSTATSSCRSSACAARRNAPNQRARDRLRPRSAPAGLRAGCLMANCQRARSCRARRRRFIAFDSHPRLPKPRKFPHKKFAGRAQSTSSPHRIPPFRGGFEKHSSACRPNNVSGNIVANTASRGPHVCN
jgi:hypothetical protein